MAEYIEREALLEILNGLYDHHLMMRNYAADGATQDCIEAVTEAPAADVVEVVRCKDCKHYKPQAISSQWEHKAKYCCRCVAIKVKPDDYCSYGVRKGEGE
jgi:hypothetical protein